MAITAELQKQNINIDDYRKYMVYDIESENHTYKGSKASPFCPDNYIILIGWKTYKDKRCYYSEHNKEDKEPWLKIPDDVNLLVGHNLKFDLFWQWENPDLIKFIKRGGKIWDTQYAEFLLNGMTKENHMLAMDDIVEKYGGRLKDNRVKDHWKAGGLTSELDPDMLVPYLIGSEEEGYNSGDIGNTELIYKGQFKRAKDDLMLTMIQERMDGILATTEAEWNGLYVNPKVAYKLLLQRHKEFKKAEANLNEYIKHIPEEVNFNLGSGQHLSCMLFGGTVFYREKDFILDEDGNKTYPMKEINVPRIGKDGKQMVGKSGQKKGMLLTKKEKVPDLDRPKMKYFDKPYTFKRLVQPEPEWKLKTSTRFNEPLYKTGDEIIQEIGYVVDGGFAKAFTDYASIKKDLSTYYKVRESKGKNEKGMFCFIGEEDVIHHSLKHVSVKTGRLASEKPNCQNISRGDKSQIKEVFTSRFEGGFMSEIDYSQLEVVVQGCLSQDINLCNDLRAGVDFHCKRVELAFGEDYPGGYDEIVMIKKDEKHNFHIITMERRTDCKKLSFKKAYGAGAKSIAKQLGKPVEWVQAIMDAEDNHYDGVVKFYDVITKTVDSNKKYVSVEVDTKEGKKRYQVLRGTWKSPTGTLYTFEGKEAPEFLKRKGIRHSISPTNIKNYPIQGTGGEMVQSSFGRMFRAMVEKGYWSNGENPHALFVNTVHDCVWLDIKDKDVADDVIPLVCEHLQAIPEVFNKLYDMNITVPFPVEAELGTSMASLHHYEIKKEKQNVPEAV